MGKSLPKKQLLAEPPPNPQVTLTISSSRDGIVSSYQEGYCPLTITVYVTSIKYEKNAIFVATIDAVSLARG